MIMEQTAMEVITKYIWGPVAVAFGYFAKKQSDTITENTSDLNRLKTDVAKLEVSAVDEEKVRTVVHEVTKPIQDDTTELKTSISSIAEGIQDLKVELARRENNNSN